MEHNLSLVRNQTHEGTKILSPFMGYIIFAEELKKMHMADALISPIVGGAMWATTAGITAYSIKKVQTEIDEKKVPLMGVMGAFIFATQMINFAIPGTGSSGHLGGGMLLAILLGPYAGFLTMSSILLIQALFFADGGLLAYGSNVFNLGFYTCFIAYPLIYKWFTRKKITSKNILFASISSAVIGLQLGSLSVVLQTVLSGKTELPFVSFLLMMQPIHLAIGIIEGLVTAAIVTFIWQARPELITRTERGEMLGTISIKRVLVGLLIGIITIGGLFSWFASTNPDGLEWSIMKTAGTTEIEASGEVYEILTGIQEKTAILPDYDFKSKQTINDSETLASETANQGIWPTVSTGTSFSGLLGSILTLVIAIITGLIINVFKKRKNNVTV